MEPIDQGNDSEQAVHNLFLKSVFSPPNPYSLNLMAGAIHPARTFHLEGRKMDTVKELKARIAELEGVLRQIRLHLPNTDERGRLHPGDYYLIEAIEEMVKAALPEGPEQQ